MKPKFTHVYHELRLDLNLTLNEYCLVDLIYNLSINPKAPVKGWCSARKDSLGEGLGLTKQSILTLIKKLESKKIIIKSEDGRLLKCTNDISQIIFNFKFTNGKESLPDSVKKVYQEQGKESLPYNNNLNNNNKNTKKNPYFISKDLYELFKYKDFAKWWLDFIDTKKRKRAAVSNRILIIQYNKLFKLANGNKDKCLEILTNSVTNGWADFYPLKEDKKNFNNQDDTPSSVTLA